MITTASFVRGEASEHIIRALANIGAAQVSIEMDGIVAHPDIMIKDKLIIELKNTAGDPLTLDFICLCLSISLAYA
jgi:glutamine phosphoribosylpyrophosphate amidotransferase